MSAKGELALAIKTMAITNKNKDDLMILTLPIRSDSFPDKKRINSDETVKTMKNGPLLATPK
jgi:hypothetical protein